MFLAGRTLCYAAQDTSKHFMPVRRCELFFVRLASRMLNRGMVQRVKRFLKYDFPVMSDCAWD